MSEATMPPQEQAVVQPSVPLTADEKMWGMFCHLSGLLGYFALGLTFVAPLICWLMKKDTSKFVDDCGKEALNFHLNILAYNVVGIAAILFTCGIGVFVFGPALILLHFYAIIVQIIAGLKANNGEMFRYPFIYRVL
jgi:uncharacterized protein